MHADLLDYDVRVRLKDKIRLILVELEEMNLPGIPLNIDDNDFLELLMNNIRNEVISYQSFVSKTVNTSLKNLTEKIEALKRDYVQNNPGISELETKLREVNEIKINSILERNKNFDTIHGERVTPFFLKMAKGFQHESSMRDICDSNGVQFASLKEQKADIRNHFANSFKKPQDEPENLQGCIERFLGEDILEHPLVHKLKLSENEKNRLDMGIVCIKLSHGR
jgi:hypothetical protein